MKKKELKIDLDKGETFFPLIIIQFPKGIIIVKHYEYYMLVNLYLFKFPMKLHIMLGLSWSVFKNIKLSNGLILKYCIQRIFSTI